MIPVIEELTALVQELQERIRVLEQAVAERDARIVELEAEVAELREELGRDSRNSSQPPSSDSPQARKKRRRKLGRRKRGGQKGHKGHHRKLIPFDEVDEVFNLYPKRCKGCGKSLPERSDGDPERHQLFEVPRVRPHVTEYRQHKTTCACCKVTTQAGLPAGVSLSPFGPRLVALIGLLTVGYRLSKRLTGRLLQDLLGIEMSLGSVSHSEQRLSRALQEPVEEAAEHVKRQHVKYSDATSWRQGVKRLQLWTVACFLVSYFKVTLDGTTETAKKLLGDFGTLVSDRAKVFLFWSMDRRQVCWAHLLRYFTAFVERGGSSADVGCRLLKQSSEMFDLWYRIRDGTMTRSAFQQQLEPIKEAVRSLLKEGTESDHKKTRGSCRNILEHFDALWTFALVEGVEPTNNHAEQQLRHLVMWRRTSFATQSSRGNVFVERMMTAIATLRKQRRDIWEYLTAAYTAHLNNVPAPSLLPQKPVTT